MTTAITDPATEPAAADGRGAKLFIEDVSDRTGLTRRTLWSYNSDAATRRRRRKARPSDLPAPDGHERRRHGPPSPWWWESTIDAWLPRRLSRGWPPDAAHRGRTSPRRKATAKTD
jgi:hypothetical protein